MTDDPILVQLARANPEPHPRTDPADEQLLVAILDRRAISPRRRRASARIVVPVLSAAVVIAVAFVFVRAGGTHRPATPATSAVTQRIVLRAEPALPGLHVTAAGMRSELALLREHLNALGIAQSASVRHIGRDEIAVVYHGAHPLDTPTFARLVSLQIAFADWEGNLIAPDGRTVASQLTGGGPVVSSLSRGGTAGPGVAGATRLYDAVRLASHQPAQPISSMLSRAGPQYFAFTKFGGYLAGPEFTRRELKAPHGALTLAVPQGTLVVQARDQSPIGAAQYQNSHARFFVLRDHVYVPSTQRLKHVTASEPRGISTLNFGFTPRGQREFRQLTAGIAHRGASLGKPDDPLLQHVAVIEDGALLSVAQIDYRVYPEGIDPATTGIPAGLQAATTQRVARELTQGILSLDLRVISR